MPKLVGKKKNARLVIANLQRTPLDGYADIKVHAKCDELMEIVMEKLGTYSLSLSPELANELLESTSSAKAP